MSEENNDREDRNEEEDEEYYNNNYYSEYNDENNNNNNELNYQSNYYENYDDTEAEEEARFRLIHRQNWVRNNLRPSNNPFLSNPTQVIRRNFSYNYYVDDDDDTIDDEENHLEEFVANFIDSFVHSQSLLRHINDLNAEDDVSFRVRYNNWMDDESILHGLNQFPSLDSILTTSLLENQASAIRKNEEQEIEVNTTFLYKDCPEKEKYEKNCCICVEPFNPDEMIAKLDCNHIFHENCIMEWGKYKTTCPICRNAIKEKNF